jgi:fructose-1,6-bisphosphatase/inositol monophosphatase family enzyme
VKDPSVLLDPLRSIHDQIRGAVVGAAQRQQTEQLAEVQRDEEGDTLYAIDAISEERLLELFEILSRNHSFVLIAEGLRGGQIVLPQGTAENAADWRIIVDPIDGTRGLMYQKRSAWILTGVAPNRGSNTSLKDIELAVQTEIPLMKQHLADQLWAIRGQGAFAERFDRLTGERQNMRLRPSTSPTIAHGFAMIARFFPGAREELASIDEEVVRAVLGPVQPGKAHCFEDQYISSGGQLYELMSGHDRFVADLRPLLGKVLQGRGLPLGLCCHPYDLCAVLIATELGVIVTDAQGRSLDAPLNVEADVTWVGYANDKIRRQVEPALQRSLRDRGWISC